MVADAALPVYFTPSLNGACLFEQLLAAVHDIGGDLIIDLAPGMRNASDRQVPCIANFRIKIYIIGVLRYCLAVAAEVDIAAEVFALKFLMGLAPTDRTRYKSARILKRLSRGGESPSSRGI